MASAFARRTSSLDMKMNPQIVSVLIGDRLPVRQRNSQRLATTKTVPPGVVLLGLVCGVASTPLTAQLFWRHTRPTQSPSARALFAMATHPTNGRPLLMGGPRRQASSKGTHGSSTVLHGPSSRPRLGRSDVRRTPWQPTPAGVSSCCSVETAARPRVLADAVCGRRTIAATCSCVSPASSRARRSRARNAPLPRGLQRRAEPMALARCDPRPV